MWREEVGKAMPGVKEQQINHRYDQQYVIRARYNNQKPSESFELVNK